MTELCLHTFINQEIYLISFPKIKNDRKLSLTIANIESVKLHFALNIQTLMKLVMPDDLTLFWGNNLVPKVNHHHFHQTRWNHVRSNDHFTSGSSLYC